MCIILIKPYNVPTIPQDVLENCWDNNDDGMGIALSFDDFVHIDKGYMDKKKAMARVNEYLDLYSDHAMMLHFRKATDGSVTPENCHPYPLSDAVEDMRALEIDTPIAVSHNGILKSAITDARKNLDLTDSAGFIIDMLYPARTYLLEEPFLKMWNKADYGKFGLLSPGNLWTRLGIWQLDEDLMYSNTTYLFKTRGWGNNINMQSQQVYTGKDTRIPKPQKFNDTYH